MNFMLKGKILINCLIAGYIKTLSIKTSNILQNHIFIAKTKWNTTFDLTNYARKLGIKRVRAIDTSKLAKKTDLLA